jgi:hypothetical protein
LAGVNGVECGGGKEMEGSEEGSGKRERKTWHWGGDELMDFKMMRTDDVDRSNL